MAAKKKKKPRVGWRATSNPEVSRRQSDLCITEERVYSHWG